jgi:hypothetical protein
MPIAHKAGYANSGHVLGGLPPRVRVKLAYYQQEAVATSVTSTQVWRGNSVFDPDFTGTGGQPYNFDDWAIFYNRYRVLGCRIITTITNTTSGNFHGSYVVYPSNSSTVAAVADAIAAPRSEVRYIGGIYSDSVNKDMVIDRSFTTREILGEDFGDRFQSLVSTNPGDPWFLCTRLTVDDSVTCSVIRRTRLIYDVEFFDLNTLTLDRGRILRMMSWLLRKWDNLEGLERHDGTGGQLKDPGDSKEDEEAIYGEWHSIVPAGKKAAFTGIDRESNPTGVASSDLERVTHLVSGSPAPATPVTRACPPIPRAAPGGQSVGPPKKA